MSEEGTLPATAPAPAASAPQPRPVRRVGTTTMGLVLIVAGIAITAGLLNPALDFSLLCKLSPLILVALGAEVLIAAFTAKQARLKYDFLSMLVCAFLIFVALCGAAAAPLMQYYGPGYQRAVNELQDRWYDQVAGALTGVDGVQDFSCGLYVEDWTGADEVRQKGFDAVSSAHVYVTLDGAYPDEDAFVQACAPVVEALKTTDVKTPYLEIHRDDGEKFYTLTLDGPYAWQQTDLSRYVNTGTYESVG